MAIQTAFLTELRTQIKTAIESIITDFKIGTDNTTPTAADTDLGASVFTDTVDEYDTATADKITVSCRVLTTEANGNAIVEVGVFDSSGNMKTRKLVTSINKTSDIQLYLDFEYTITVAEA